MPFYDVSIGIDYVKSEYFKHRLFAQDDDQLNAIVASMSVEDILERGREDGSGEGGYSDDNIRVADADVVKRMPRTLIGLAVTCESDACVKRGSVIAVEYFDGAGEETLADFIRSWRAVDETPAICSECHQPGTLSDPLAGNAEADACTCAHKVNAPDCRIPDCEGHDPTCSARHTRSDLPRDTHHAAPL